MNWRQQARIGNTILFGGLLFIIILNACTIQTPDTITFNKTLDCSTNNKNDTICMHSTNQTKQEQWRTMIENTNTTRQLP